MCLQRFRYTCLDKSVGHQYGPCPCNAQYIGDLIVHYACPWCNQPVRSEGMMNHAIEVHRYINRRRDAIKQQLQRLNRDLVARRMTDAHYYQQYQQLVSNEMVVIQLALIQIDIANQVRLDHHPKFFSEY